LTDTLENPTLLHKVRITNKLDYLENIIRPSLAASAESLQARLLEVFIGLRVIPPTEMGGKNKQFLTEGARDYDLRYHQLTECQEHLDVAFLKALDLRVTLAKSQLKYDFRFPRQGDEFQQWMEQIPQAIPALEGKSRICLCLRPAIFSRGRIEGSLKTKLVIPALVMLDRS
jgi:hypothetical protein